MSSCLMLQAGSTDSVGASDAAALVTEAGAGVPAAARLGLGVVLQAFSAAARAARESTRRIGGTPADGS
ncbi:hypothetical protein [Microbispora sp. H10949]|uniref:hypothetical protein n=1 Tax=Microbispora sp. H10949 TaxID=2729111 RepID=UPI001603B5BA|nr:hypothetical protein [Microbispora sp. H10949]